ncbi:hypothetical protein [Demequina silvatica]|uniref:hypothetical protein n=1 Tax=Demequina silvatica TaxID=1638988 RepID=UPI0007860D11|nr:hypothetical protein [Demequina silvatica]
MTELEKRIAAAIEDSETSRDVAPPEGTPARRRNREASSVYSLRLPNEVIAELTVVAAELNLPVSALIRGFILDGLASQRGVDLHGALDRLERDVRDLRRVATRA